MPGIPEPPIRHFCRDMSRETLRQFTLENRRKRQLFRNLTALKTPHICAGDTLLQQSNHGNRKSTLGCAQTVEDRTSLWKPQEKWKETPTSRGGIALRPRPKISSNELWRTSLKKHS